MPYVIGMFLFVHSEKGHNLHPHVPIFLNKLFEHITY